MLFSILQQPLKKICTIILVLFSFIHIAHAEEYHLQWGSNLDTFQFKGAEYSSKYAYLPHYSITKSGKWELSSNIQVQQSKRISNKYFTSEQLELIKEDWLVETHWGTQRKQTVTTFEILPFRKVGSEVEVLESFTINNRPSSSNARTTSMAMQYASQSVLATGNWYKIGVEKNGVYKIDAAFLEKLGINVQNLQSHEIKIYGHKGGMLPERSGEDRTDDLREIPIKVIGQGSSIVVHAYLEGPEKWYYDATRQMFRHQKNLYTDQKCYFITVNSSPGLRINNRSDIVQAPTKNIQSFDDYVHYEDDINNLLESGKIWLGNEIAGNNILQYDFNFPNIISSTPAKIALGIAARSTNNSNPFQVNSNSTLIRNISISSVGSSYLANAANYSETFSTLNNPTASFPVTIQYNRPDFSAKAWLDYITVNAQRNLAYTSSPLYFRSISSVGNNEITQFQISNWNANALLWDVTDIFNIQQIPVASGSFKAATNILREFVAFQEPQLVPNAIGKIENQNLHALDQVDYLIITRKALSNYANEIGDFHLQQEGYTYHVVDVENIFNEFSSGNNDLSAIRNFVKMFYDRAASNPDQAPKYLLLFGNGNFDNKKLGEYLLPSYQSSQSFQTVETYVTDDYFGFLDDHEGADVINTSTHLLDIAIGRITVDDIDKARNAVDKIKRYYSQSSYGDWRTQIAFVADDQDNNIHIRDADEVADIIQNQYPNYNVSKIYLDAFKQQSVSGGQRYPDVNEAINNKIYTGLFYLNFVGHGGPNGLTDEKINTFDDINRWKNEDKLFLFCTATCEFTRFDLPNRFSAGERVLLKRDGGAIVLVSTTRLVFSDKNRIINENFTNELFKSANNTSLSIGDIFLKTKNITNTRENNRKFALFGDPALSLAFPQHEIVTTEVLSHNTPSDTIQSLAKINIKGEVREQQQLSTSFNGIVNVTVYDKMTQQSTLSNDSDSPTFNFKTRPSVIYKGRTKATQGKFEISFIVPKDINYNYGQGKLSYYGENGTWDAVGHDLDVVIGGVTDSIPIDNKGPIVEVFIDDENFAFGGIASKNSVLLIKLEDENGINTSGTGLGHDITAILNENSKQPLILNSFYEGEIGNYRIGQIKYPFNSLENGRYKVNVKAWDVLNNSGEGYTEFVVEDKAELALYHVLNYPNPFTTNTQFSFEHNRPGEALDVKVEIFTVSGKLIKTLALTDMSGTRRISNLNWDGLDDYGDKIGRGVYVYKVSVKNFKGEKAMKYQKLVILR